jgi:uncharacterized coiled-coil DUF342 family protein
MQEVRTEEETQLLALETKMEELRQTRDGIIEELKTLTRQRDQVYATVEAQRAIAQMTNPQRAALAQVLGVSGVPSTAEMGSNNASVVTPQ